MNKKERIEGTIINSNGLCINNNNPSLEKTADELFKELGFKKQYENESIYYYMDIDLKDNYIVFETGYKSFAKISCYHDAGDITMQELKAINEKVRELRLDIIETETGKVLNKLAREQFKSKLLAEILIDLQVCKLENLNPKEYIEELKQEIDNIYERFNNENE